ncbi:MAG TPA: phosphoribosylformylglycinamidine cyclo-ligase [Thermoanaerobaculia bacterium]|nr:phosphoribosylformylglycinamidine cyclo-ligase [Thermoanaerobaculia bacterium]
MNTPTQNSAYQAAGVDIDAQERGLAEVKRLAKSTFTTAVLSEIGLFGGLYRPDLRGMVEPVLVASADGVGTKLRVAEMANDFSTVGRDLVNHCVNDILVQGASPIFFLDYVGAGVLDPDKLIELVRGVAAGCRDHGCALLGGETAEMPGFYRPGDYELVGFVVGLVDRPKILDGSRVRVGDRLLGLPSAGLHTNGYSLARRVLFDTLGLRLGDRLPGSSDTRSVGELLLAPHLSYYQVLQPYLGHPGLHALAHITGGGFTDNLPRVLPEGTAARVELGSWRVPELFRVLAEAGGVEAEEQLRVFNLGIGMVVVLDPAGAESLAAAIPDVEGKRPVFLGEVIPGDGRVHYHGHLSKAP